MKYGLIGRKLSHSFSPEIHGKIGDYKYELFSLEEEQLEPFMKKRDFSGINVTIPYKSAVIPYLDFVDEEAELIGSVNTVVKRDGLLYGYNTDVTGLTMLITRVCGSTLDGKALVLGTGGTSLTAVYALKKLGVKEIYRVSRGVKDGCITYEDALKHHSDAKYVINTTPCGMYPNVYETPIDISAFTSLKGVVDAIFNPLSTPLVRKAKEMGVASEGGLFMLVSQAVAAYCHFFDKEADFGICSKIYEEILKEKQNIVLVGMPSSGKSSIGKELSVITGKPFYDSDEVIKEKVGMTIPEIFEKYGENHFRAYESDVISELSKKSGVIIATGGGAVLKSENVDALKANGIIVFLDRPLDMLTPTSDRPLSADIEMLKKRYNERYPIYTAVSDMTVPSVSDVKTVAKMVEEEWKK